jgi:purine nucleosidase
MRIFIDTDIGTDVDDSLALALAAQSPEIELAGVTVVTGDTALRARIARKILSLAGKGSVPVAAGCSTNLLQTKSGLMKGHEGDGILETETDKTPSHSGHAVDFLLEQIKKAHGKSTIVTIGPLTNLALAIIKEPGIIDYIEKLVIMGGCVYPEQLCQRLGVPTQIALKMEYNLGIDPEADEVVFRAGIPTILVPAEVTYQVWMTDDDRVYLQACGTHLAQKLNAAINIWVAVYRKMLVDLGLPGDLAKPYLHDPLTVATAFEQRFVKIEAMHIRLERVAGQLRTMRYVKKKPNMEVAISVDAAAFRAFLLARLCKS